MDVKKNKGQVILVDDNKRLSIQLMNNGDLYWKIIDNTNSIYCSHDKIID